MSDMPTFDAEEFWGDSLPRRLESERERYWLAWMSARQRATNHLLALAESDDERHALRAALADEDGSRDRYRLAWMSARRRASGRRQNFLKLLGVAAARLIALDEMTQQRDEERALVRIVDLYGTAYRWRTPDGQELLLDPAEVDVFIGADRDTDVERFTAERDEARAEVDRAHARANEAARLSADARDRADDLNGVIAELREQIAIVEGDRDNVTVWVYNTAAEFGLGDDPAVWLPDIAAYMREQRDAIATYRHVTDSSIETREWAYREAERIAAERNEARAEVVRLGRQVEKARQAYDALNVHMIDGGVVTPYDLAPLFDALFPKWGGEGASR